MTAHPESHQAALMLPARYIQATPGERDPRAFTPDESRRARALAMYAALRVLGREGVVDTIERCCSLATRMAARLAQHESIRLLNDVVLNQVLVQFKPPGGDAAAAMALTQTVIARVQEEGTCWAGGTTWHGQAAMRVSISNWSTSAEDIDRSAAAVLAVLTAFNAARAIPGAAILECRIAKNASPVRAPSSAGPANRRINATLQGRRFWSGC